MKANQLGFATTHTVASVVRKTDIGDEIVKLPHRNQILVWISIASLLMGTVSVVLTSIAVWRIEHVHIHVAEIIAHVYECDGRPSNTSACGVVAHL